MCPSGPAGSAAAAGAAPATGAAAGMTVAAADCPGCPPRLMRTFSSPSVISSSAIPDCSTRSISFLSLRKSIGNALPEMTRPLPARLKRVLERQFVAHGAETADNPDRYIGKVRTLAERLPGEHVGDVYFHERKLNRAQRIPQRNAGMGKAGRIDDDEVYMLARSLLDTLEQPLFRIALKRGEPDSCGGCPRLQARIDIGESVAAVMLRLAHSEQIQIRPMQHQDVTLGGRLGNGPFFDRH